jgi:hypothetical protein
MAENTSANTTTTCTAVLTRGYNSCDGYAMLIRRNNAIHENIKNTNIDHLVFHEGNITIEHQQYIQGKTPNLPLKFIDISDIAFKKEKEQVVIIDVAHFNVNYRHMCHFWFIDFLKASHSYDKLLRIDEDCFMQSSVDNIFAQLESHTFVAATMSPDSEPTSRGLNALTLDFIRATKVSLPFAINNENDMRVSQGPYTNLIGFNLGLVRQNVTLQKYLETVDKSEKIYERRWGDLPLWGEAIYYIFGDNTLKIDNTIRYYHQSHNCQVN